MAQRESDEEAGYLQIQARAFLAAARENLAGKAFFLSALCAQQAVELMLKAAWLKTQRRRPPLTHDTLRLGRELRAPRVREERLARLAAAYMESRYPDAAGRPPVLVLTGPRARQLVDDAVEVMQWLARSYHVQ